MVQTKEGRPFSLRGMVPRGGQQNEPHDLEGGSKGTGEVQDAAYAAWILSRLRALLGVETSPTNAAALTRGKATEGRRAERAAALEVDGLRKENSDLRRQNSNLKRQLAESQDRMRALKEELSAGAGAQTETSFAKPYENVSDADHEKVLAFIKRYELDEGEDYDRALMVLLGKGEVKVRR